MYFRSCSVIWMIQFCPEHQMAAGMSKVSGYFLSISLSDMQFSSLLRSTLTLWLHHSTVRYLHAWLEHELAPLRRLPVPGGHSLCEQVDTTWSAHSAFPHILWRRMLSFTPNRSGNLPTAHIWALCVCMTPSEKCQAWFLVSVFFFSFGVN